MRFRISKFFERGTALRQALAEDWRDKGAYVNALSITRQAFVREHFPPALNAKPASL